MSGDDGVDHDRWWHEDDVVHQAEGVLSVQHGVPMSEAVAALRAYSRDVGVRRRTVAFQVTSRQVSSRGGSEDRAMAFPDPAQLHRPGLDVPLAFS